MNRSSDSEVKKTRKTDRRTLYTRKVIMDAYIQLLKEKPKEKIHITELCKIAEINRCTFYLHFEDIQAVEEAIEEKLFHKFKDFIKTQNSNSRNRQSLSNTFIDTMLHDENYRTLMSVNVPSSDFLSFLSACYLDDLKKNLPPKHHLTEKEQEILYAFIVGGVIAVEQNWIKNNADIRKENYFLDRIVSLLIKEISSTQSSLIIDQ